MIGSIYYVEPATVYSKNIKLKSISEDDFLESVRIISKGNTVNLAYEHESDRDYLMGLGLVMEVKIGRTYPMYLNAGCGHPHYTFICFEPDKKFKLTIEKAKFQPMEIVVKSR